LRARPEQTQLEDLSDASFLGKLLVLPVRLDWRVFARYKTPANLASSSATKKECDNIDSRKFEPSYDHIVRKAIIFHK
jgi:hypothetical protein